MNDGDLPGFDPTVLAIDGLGSADLGVLEIDPLLLVDKQLDVVSERALVALQGEDVIGFLVEDRLRDVTLAAHRVDGYDRTLDLQHAQELGDGDDLVGLLPHLDLAEYETLSRGESRHDVDRTLESFFFFEAFEPDRRTVLPSMATTSAGTPVCAATQATKQRSKASVSKVARMSPK